MYELRPVEGLTAPALVVAFLGWVNAGGVGTEAAGHIAGDGEVVATFDPDALFDYRSNRPIIDLVDGTLREVTWPEVTLRRITRDHRDLLVLSGNEPDWQWQAFGRAVTDLATRLGIAEVVSLGGVPAAVPHTRPTRLMTTASRPHLIGEGEQLPEGLLRVPGAAVSILEHFLTGAGIPAVGFWAQVPHYVSGTYYAGAITLIDRAARHLEVEIPLGDLVDRAAEQQRQLDETVAGQAESRAYLERLEAIAGAQESIPSGEEIAAQVERFLREAADGENESGF